MTDTTDLGTFEGHDVLTTSVKVTNAGDGLSQALAVDPQLLHHGDRGAIIIEYEVAKVGYDPIKDTDGLTRIHTLKALRGTLVDLDIVRERLDAQQRRIEAAEGTLQLDLEGGEPQSIGDVLNDAIDLAAAADDDETWAAERTELLNGWDKAGLTELAKGYGASGYSSWTKAELVEWLVAHELDQRAGDGEG
jgi:hypothetical protein